ncbi:MAG TPA: alpha/beta fold hydrolase [Candidatus Polarisedimenticolia bacterium]|nr:alpha/beta fold hydrolase [Candidatus Polarisedimenticolia bacterium]
MRSHRLRIAVGAVALAALLPAGCGGPAETSRQVAQYTIEDFMGTTNYSGAAFSPDKSKILVSSDQSGVFNAYAVPVSGGEPVALTSSTTDSIFAQSYFPADERFVYTSDQGGNELTHIFVRELDGSVQDLTPGEKLKARFHGWSHDDRSFFIDTNERDERYFDLYEVAVDGYRRELIFKNEEGFEFGDISPDKRFIALGKEKTNHDSDIYLHDRQTGETRLLTVHEGEVSNATQQFSPDGRSLYFTTDEGHEFKYLVRYDLAGGGREVIEKPDWDVWYAYFSRDGKYMVMGINNDARTEIRLYEAATMKQLDLPKLPDADITAVRISRDEKTMAFYVSSSRHPNDLYVHELGGGEPVQLTRSLNRNINPADLVEAKVVRFASHGGVEVPGILYKPHQASVNQRAPALVWVHGGPGGQSRAGYSALIQYLVNHGYVIYAINNRGSSGYGKTFYRMDDRRHGEDDLADCVESKKMLIETGYVDAARIGIIGGSYGGYMVLAALAFQPEEFAVGVDIFGVANWVRTLESIPPWWESFRQALYQELGDPARDAERLRRISPLFHAGRITKPLMVLQGANDPRVLKVESDEMVESARANGAVVEYIVFDDEGHGFRKKKNQLKGNKAILEFLDKYLKGGAESGQELAA